MGRDRDERDQDRANLIRILTEADGPLWTSAIIDRTATYDIQPGSAEHRQVLADLRALEREGHLLCLQRSRFTTAAEYVLAGTQLADEHEDAADVARAMARWEPAS